MNITVLGSCRQDSIKQHYPTTSIQERLTYPHYTKEIIQAIQYCKGISTFDNEHTRYCFRTGILENNVIPYQKVLQQEFEATDAFVIEIASRISYAWNGIYVHHILTEESFGFQDRSHILTRELSDDEIEQDLLTIQQLLHPKPFVIVSHIHTRQSGTRYELIQLLEKLTEKHHIPFINPSRLLMNHDNLYQAETPLHHYTEHGHRLIGYEYKKAIDALQKVCIHTYLTKCQTNPQPPGLADFLRGTIALYQFCKQYHYDLQIDSSHPIFRYIQPHPKLICDNPFSNVIEFIPPPSYDDIYDRLEKQFQTGLSFCTLTNSFYTRQGTDLVNFGPISDDCRTFLQSLFTPTDEIEQKINFIFKEVFHFQKEEGFTIIHLRCGDLFLHDGVYDDGLYSRFYHLIHPIVHDHKETRYVLLSDSSAIAERLKKDIPELYYWNNSKVHLGDLIHRTDSSVLDTLVDFFMMSQSNEILSGPNSGFSVVSSLLYNIPYRYI